MRLIDADALKSRFGYNGLDTEEDISWNRAVRLMIEEQPTAYDVGKVVLDIVKTYDSCENCSWLAAHECTPGHCQIKEVIEIVKNGGC